MIDPVRWIAPSGNILSEFAEGIPLLPGKLRLIDQTLLPERLEYLETDDIGEIFDAIKTLKVRGAPAIGCAAALGLAAVSQHSSQKDGQAFIAETRGSADFLAKSRPTAVNLFWALDRCVAALRNSGRDDVGELKKLLLKEALEILKEDILMCRSIGEAGLPLMKAGMGVLTHCNAGALATGDYGTALSPIYLAHEKGIHLKVYADETRPLLQGARLTAWELKKAGVDVTVICDNMAAVVMRDRKVDLVIVGADRIAVNGDAANKIGTYSVAILADFHKIPFYVAAPYSTIDFTLADGSGIPIEERGGDEIRCGFGRRTVLPEIATYNPAFDVTPNRLIKGIITEKGIVSPPFKENILKLYRQDK